MEYLVKCQYKEAYGKFGSQVYSFKATEDTKPEEGTLITVLDRYGVSLVKCVSVEVLTSENTPDFALNDVVDLAKINANIVKVRNERANKKENL